MWITGEGCVCVCVCVCVGGCSDWCHDGGADQKNLPVSGYNECHPGPQQVLHCCMGPGIIWIGACAIAICPSPPAPPPPPPPQLNPCQLPHWCSQTLLPICGAKHWPGPQLAPFARIRKNIFWSWTCVCVCVCVFVRQISQSQVFFPPSRSFKVVNSIFNSKAVNENEILWDRSYTIKSDIKHFFEKCLRLRRLPKTESIVLAGSKLNAQIQCLFCSTSCSHWAKAEV